MSAPVNRDPNYGAQDSPLRPAGRGQSAHPPPSQAPSGKLPSHSAPAFYPKQPNAPPMGGGAGGRGRGMPPAVGIAPEGMGAMIPGMAHPYHMPGAYSDVRPYPESFAPRGSGGSIPFGNAPPPPNPVFNGGPSGPPRTHSAPPSLLEQEASGLHLQPHLAHNFGHRPAYPHNMSHYAQAPPAGYQMYFPPQQYQQQFYAPQPIPQPQTQTQTSLNASAPAFQPRERKAVAIINPNTGEVLNKAAIDQSPPAAVATTSEASFVVNNAVYKPSIAPSSSSAAATAAAPAQSPVSTATPAASAPTTSSAPLSSQAASTSSTTAPPAAAATSSLSVSTPSAQAVASKPASSPSAPAAVTTPSTGPAAATTTPSAATATPVVKPAVPTPTAPLSYADRAKAAAAAAAAAPPPAPVRQAPSTPGRGQAPAAAAGKAPAPAPLAQKTETATPTTTKTTPATTAAPAPTASTTSTTAPATTAATTPAPAPAAAATATPKAAPVTAAPAPQTTAPATLSYAERAKQGKSRPAPPAHVTPVVASAPEDTQKKSAATPREATSDAKKQRSTAPSQESGKAKSAPVAPTPVAATQTQPAERVKETISVTEPAATPKAAEAKTETPSNKAEKKSAAAVVAAVPPTPPVTPAAGVSSTRATPQPAATVPETAAPAPSTKKEEPKAAAEAPAKDMPKPAPVTEKVSEKPKESVVEAPKETAPAAVEAAKPTGPAVSLPLPKEETKVVEKKSTSPTPVAAATLVPAAAKEPAVQPEEKKVPVMPAAPTPATPQPAAAAPAQEEVISLRPGTQTTKSRSSSVAEIVPVQKKIYAREFLLQFRLSCSERPADLLPMDIVEGDKTGFQNRQGGGGGGGNRAATGASPRNAPGFPKHERKTSEGHRGGGGDGFSRSQFGDNTPRSGRNTGRGGGGRKAQPPPPSLPPVSPLIPTKNRWQANTTTDEDEQARKKIKGILNKITIEKFAILTEKLIQLDIPTLDRLKDLITLVFDKAVSEPTFSFMYADLCITLSGRLHLTHLMEPTTQAAPTKEGEPSAQQKQQTSLFRRMLLNRCQEEFYFQPKMEELQQLSDEERAATERKIKQRMLGNIKFIGELFKRRMLTEGIIHECVTRLMFNTESPDEEDIESLCKLLTTVGKMLEAGKGKDKMDHYFARIHDMKNNQKFSSRIRFMLQDVIDLKSTGWRERRVQETAKTLDEIRADAEREAAGGGRGGNRPPLLPTPAQQQQGHARRNTSGISGPAPSGRGSNDVRSSSDVRGHDRSRSSQDVRGPAPAPAPAAAPRALARRPSEDDVHREDRNNKGDVSLRPARGAESRSRDSTPVAARPAPAKPVMDEDRVRTKTKDVVNEYLSNNDEADAIQTVKDLNCAEFHAALVSEAISLMLEKKPRDRKRVSDLILALAESKVITSEQLHAGLDSILEIVEDLVIDIPDVSHYLSELLGVLLVGKQLQLNQLKNLGPLVENGKAIEFILNTFEHIGTHEGVHDLRLLYETMKEDLVGYLPSADRSADRLRSLMEKQGISKMLSSSPSVSEYIQEALIENQPADAILKWIEAHAGEDPERPAFARTVTRCVLRFVLDIAHGKERRESQSEERLIEQYRDLLRRFVSSTVAHQLQGLFEIQNVCYEVGFPKGLIKRLFKMFYEHDIVFEDAIEEWKEDTSDKTPGKVEAVIQLNEWLNWLKEAEEEDDEDAENDAAGSDPTSDS